MNNLIKTKMKSHWKHIVLALIKSVQHNCDSMPDESVELSNYIVECPKCSASTTLESVNPFRLKCVECNYSETIE